MTYNVFRLHQIITISRDRLFRKIIDIGEQIHVYLDVNMIIYLLLHWWY